MTIHFVKVTKKLTFYSKTLLYFITKAVLTGKNYFFLLPLLSVDLHSKNIKRRIIIICVAAFVCITIMILITLRNKVKVLFGNIVEHFSRNSLNASAADLVDELLPPIYNPTTQAGILPPEGYR